MYGSQDVYYGDLSLGDTKLIVRSLDLKFLKLIRVAAFF